jgi:hypothetical protein
LPALDHRRIADFNKRLVDPADKTATLALNRAPAAHQVNHHQYQGDHQQDVNQAAPNAETKSQKPQNQKYRYKCPKHNFLSCDLKNDC